MSYSFVTESGVVLKVIKTSPNNIEIKRINDNVCDSGYFGINGGFYYQGSQLSITVNDNQAINGSQGDYGSGWYNHGYDRGTLVWDRKMGVYSIQVVGSASDLVVSDRTSYWAQGGVSMNLQDDANWKQQAIAENLPDIDTRRPRTGLVYNTGFNIWLVITKTPCTAHEFRYAIKGQLGNETIVDGIFLDSGGSTQMNCAELEDRGDGRNVLQMIALKDN